MSTEMKARAGSVVSTDHGPDPKSRSGALRVRLALAAGLTLMAIAIGVTLTRSPIVVAGTNSIPDMGELASTSSDATACQADELPPGGTSAIRLTLEAVVGPRLSVTELSGAHVVARGVTGAGWTGAAVTVALRPVARAASRVRVCFGLGSTNGPVVMLGRPTDPAVAAVTSNGRPLPGRVGVEYLRESRGSWSSIAAAVARRMGLGHAAAGTWVAPLLLAAMASLLAGASWLTVRELR
jgi:hypothetical protein